MAFEKPKKRSRRGEAGNIVRFPSAPAPAQDVAPDGMTMAFTDDILDRLDETARNLMRLSGLLSEMDRLCRGLPFDTENGPHASVAEASADAVSAPVDARNRRILEEARRRRRKL